MNGSPFQWNDPHTWPTFFIVWAIVAIAGWLAVPIWRWLKRRRVARWSTTAGIVESASLNLIKKRWILQTDEGAFSAEIRYSYSVGGKSEEGKYNRKFGTEEEASGFVRDLQGKPIEISYNANKPAISAVTEPAITNLLALRGPDPSDESISTVWVSRISPVLLRLLKPLVVLSTVGFALSLYELLAGNFFGKSLEPDALFVLLHLGVFAVWLPTMLVVKARFGTLKHRDFWKTLMRGTPAWVKYLFYVVIGYETVTSFVFFVKAFGSQPAATGAAAPPMLWFFADVWIVFYAAGFAILYSAMLSAAQAPRCTNGHLALRGASFCTLCGQPVMRSMRAH